MVDRNFLDNIPDDNPQCRLVRKIILKYLKGIVITHKSGQILYSVRIDPKLRLELISQFIAALSMFGEEIGKIRSILILGPDVEISIREKGDLILSVFFRPDMVKDYLEEEADYCLDLFYSKYKKYIDSGRSNENIYTGFDRDMCNIFRDYLMRIGIIGGESDGEKTGIVPSGTGRERAAAGVNKGP